MSDTLTDERYVRNFLLSNIQNNFVSTHCKHFPTNTFYLYLLITAVIMGRCWSLNVKIKVTQIDEYDFRAI